MSRGDVREPSITLPPFDSARSLADVVHHTLREAITDGLVAPGTRLREVAIAKELSVSPTPVREALRRLEREGLVDVTSYRGAAVAVVSPTMMADLYELHETLEAFAVRRAAERGPHDLTPLDAMLQTIDQSVALPDQTVFNRLDVRFHRMLNDLGGNRQVADLIEQTHRRIQAARVHLDIHLPDRPRTSHVQHRAMLDAVAAGDAARAEELAQAHIRSVRDPALKILKEVTSSDSVTPAE